MGLYYFNITAVYLLTLKGLSVNDRTQYFYVFFTFNYLLVITSEGDVNSNYMYYIELVKSTLFTYKCIRCGSNFSGRGPSCCNI